MIQKDDLFYIKEVLAGHNDAFGALVDRYKEMVYTLATGLLRDPQEAEEAAQDAFLKAFQSLKGFRRKAKFSTWLYRIVYNECISRLRKRRVDTVPINDQHMIGDHDIAGHDFENLTDPDEQRSLLDKALRTLPEVDRTIVMLYYYDELSVEEIARITSLTISNVKIKLFRARKKLYEELQPVLNNPTTIKITS